MVAVRGATTHTALREWSQQPPAAEPTSNEDKQVGPAAAQQLKEINSQFHKSYFAPSYVYQAMFNIALHSPVD